MELKARTVFWYQFPPCWITFSISLYSENKPQLYYYFFSLPCIYNRDPWSYYRATWHLCRWPNTLSFSLREEKRYESLWEADPCGVKASSSMASSVLNHKLVHHTSAKKRRITIHRERICPKSFRRLAGESQVGAILKSFLEVFS